MVGIGEAIAAGLKILDKFIPDQDKAREAKKEIELAILSNQTLQQQINLKEAEHSSMFVAGWRPFVGWVCGSGLAYAGLGQPILSWLSQAFGGPAFPTVNVTELVTLLLGLLGLGGIRTYEKINDVARENGIKMTTSPIEAIRKIFSKKDVVTQYRD